MPKERERHPNLFQMTYQSDSDHVPAGLMMKTKRLVVTEDLENIINPAGHCDSDTGS
jgi:hypothetical protein